MRCGIARGWSFWVSFLLCFGWRTKMENNMKQITKNSICKWFACACLLFVGMQSAWAQNTNPVTCKGTVYFKAPDDWTAAYIGGQNVNIVQKMTLNDEGFYEFNLANLRITDNQKVMFTIGNQNTTSATLRIVTATKFNATPTNGVNDTSWPTNDASLRCPGDGKSIYVAENPNIAGRTYTGEYAADAKYFYMLVPEEKLWQSDELIISYTTPKGTKKDTTLAPSMDLCGWVQMVFNVPPSDAIFYLKNSPDIKLGINGLWDDDDIADPVDLALVFEAYGVNKLYFIPDDNAWPSDDGSQGWYTAYPNVEGTCSFSLAAVIYDTDMSVNDLFTDCCGDDKSKNNMTVDACVGVIHNLVKTDLGADGKPEYNGQNPKAATCFLNEARFKTLFNYTPGVNEVQCYDMPFRHYGTDTRWGFDSDSAVSGTGAGQVIGGFYPLENSTANTRVMELNGVATQPLDAARKKRQAAGPVPNNSKEVFGVELDYVCTTPGFTGKIRDCEGYFADGSEFTSPDLWCWGSYCADAVGVPGFQRWGLDGEVNKTVTRNQHF